MRKMLRQILAFTFNSTDSNFRLNDVNGQQNFTNFSNQKSNLPLAKK